MRRHDVRLREGAPLNSRRPRSGRDPHELHRASTPLELLFDLSFVVAIALAAAQLHHGEAAHHWSAVPQYLAAFFGIWWAWMNYTWFASAYDTDDTLFRLLTMAQMFGVLVFAVGVPGFFEGDFRAAVLGYALMRLALVTQWLLAARDDAPRRCTCLRYATGILTLQLLWVLRLASPEAWLWPSFVLLVGLELAVPVWAERAGGTPWHPHHIAERYALLVIITLGECVLGATNAVANLWRTSGWSLDLALVGLGSMLVVLGVWWVYSLLPSGELLHHHRERAFVWGYWHYAVFAAIAAMGSGLEVAADTLGPAGSPDGSAGHAITPLLAMVAVAIPQAVVLVALWGLQWHGQREARGPGRATLVGLGGTAVVVTAVAVGLSLPWGLMLLSCNLALVVIIQERTSRGLAGGGTAH